MNELDLEDLESRLYSQVYHGLNDETAASDSHENSGAVLPNPAGFMRQPGRYFGPWSPTPKHHRNGRPKETTPGRRDNRHQGSYNKSFGKPRKPEVSINPVVVVNPNQPVYMNAKEKSRARWKLKVKEKRWKKKQALKALYGKTGKQVERQEVITLSDSEDDSCVIVDNKWPVLSVADSDDDTLLEENKEKWDSKTDSWNEQKNVLNESVSEDVIFVEPVVVPVEIINLDEDTCANKDKHIETASSTSSDNISVNSTPTKSTTQKLQQERKELLRTPDSASNDFMNSSGVELNRSNFNFSLHGSDFNSGEFLKPAPRPETCETESSSSTTDVNSVNLMKTIVFNEVDFPKEDLFSENNLETFGNFITPLRNSPALTSVQSSPLRVPECQNSSDSGSESESQPERQKDAQKLKNLPELSPMQSKQNVSTPTVTKKSKRSGLESKYDFINGDADTSMNVKMKNTKKKKKNKKKKSGNEDNVSTFETSEVEETQVEEETRKKRRSSQMEDAGNTDSQPKKRNVSVNNAESVQEINDKLATEIPGSTHTENEQTEDDKSSAPVEENIVRERASSVVKNEKHDENVDVNHPINTSLLEFDDKPKESADEVENGKNIKTENDIGNETLPPSELRSSPLDGLVVVDEVYSQNNTQVQLSDAESVLSPLDEPSDIQLNCEEQKIIEQDCVTVEFGMDLNNFTVAELQLKMSSDPKLWSILEADRSPSKRNRGRRCNRCKQFGHVSVRCTARVEVKCSLCGGQGHYEPRCPNKLCTQCGQRSPYATTYCNSCFKFRNYRCELCSMTGHASDKCPDLWRRYHLTTSEGPLITSDGPPLKERNQLWCSGCARSGHLEHSCRFYKSIYPPAVPLIKSYDDIYKEETTQQEAPQYPPPSYHTNNQLYQPAAPRHMFGVQNYNYNHANPQFVNPFMDGVFVANQQNFFPPNLLQYPQNNYQPNNNQMVFQNALPTFISFDSAVPSTNTYQEVPELKFTSRYFKPKRSSKSANSMFFNSSATQLQQFVNEELRRLAKISMMSGKLVQEVRKRQGRRDYEMLNMLLFGVFNLMEGKMHFERLKQFSWGKKNKVDAGTRRHLHVSYCYIFGGEIHPGVDYNELLRIV